MKPPLISTGKRTTPITNDLVRTAARYSRRATSHTLRIAPLLRLRARDPHEDVVQRRPGVLEQADPPAAHQRVQQRRRVGAGAQAQLVPAAAVVDLLDPGQS